MLPILGENTPMNTVWRKKTTRVLVAASVVCAFFVFFGPRGEEELAPPPEPVEVVANITISPNVECDVDTEFLRRLNVLNLTDYVRREVVAVQSAKDALPLTQFLETPLFEQKRPIVQPAPTTLPQSLDGCSVPTPISLHVSRPPGKADASHIDFGIATTLDRLDEALDAFTHWAGYTHARIFALISSDERVPEVLAKAENLGVELYVTQSDDEYQTKYFSLVKHLAEHGRQQTRWSVIMDDDTFFPSMTTLVAALEEYNHTQPMYIGGLSESIPQIGFFGLMGFGGAGIFLSRPLIQKLSQPEIFDACQQMDFTGDRRISLCIYQYTDTQLTINHGLRQLDILGDVSGFFEANRPLPISVHHWKSWFHTDMVKLSQIGKVCGDSCLLRKWRFPDGWILTNGFSIVKYSSEISPDDRSMELTWQGDHNAAFESFLHELGPLRLKDEGKISYVMEDSMIDGDRVRQWYIRRDPENGQQIMELIWRRG